MMNKKKQGFSLAELLISLLIISIVLSAAIPTITKKSGASRENIWHWSDQNNSVYSALGDNQSVLVGVDRLISIDKDSILQDNSGEDWNLSATEKNEIAFTLSNKGDKLAILKRQAYSGESDFANSHISFYNTYIDGANPVIKYAGRLTMDPGNIALGIGSLQKQDANSQNVTGENTAIGHLAMTFNESGVRNTALGRKTLTRNIEGSNNTAVGFGALYTMGADRAKNASGEIQEGKTIADANTAVGSMAQRYLLNGKDNTSLGYASLYINSTGNENTALGNYSLLLNTGGDRNTAVGAYSCGKVESGQYEDGTKFGNSNICLGYQSGATGYFIDSIPVYNYGLHIGTPIIDPATGKPSEASGQKQPALITGHTIKEYVKGSDNLMHLLDKELTVSARKVVFGPYDGSSNTFEFISNAGPFVLDPAHLGKNIPEGCPTACKDGYSSLNNVPRFGVANFNLRDTGGTVPSASINHASIALTFDAPYADRMTYISAYDKYKSVADDIYSDINFDKSLTLDFPKTIRIFDKEIDATSNYKVAIRAENPLLSNQNKKFPLLLNDIMELNAPLDATGKPSNALVTFNFPKDKGLRFGFKAIDSTTGNTVAGTNAPKSYMEFANENFNIVFNNKIDATDPANPIPQAEFFQLSSANGLRYLTEQRIQLMSSATWNKIQFGGTEPTGSGVPNNADIYIDNHDILMKGLKSGTQIQDFTDNVGTNANGSVINGFNMIGKTIKELKTEINTLKNGTPSDIRLKNVTGDSTAGLKEINALEVKNFTYKEDKEKTPHVGVIAQQLQKIFPNSVSKDDKGYLRIKTEEIFYAMVNSIKELCKQIQDLTARVTGLDKRITELEKQNKLLAEQNKAFEKRLQKLEKQSAKQ